jgi:hypothetical protein
MILLLCAGWAAGGTIAGRIVGLDGEPVEGASVMVCEKATGIPVVEETFAPFNEDLGKVQALAVAISAMDGVFRMENVKAGEYRLIAQSWSSTSGVEKVFEVIGSEVILHGTAEHVVVPSEKAEQLVIEPLGTGVLMLDEDFPNDDSLFVVSTAPPAGDAILRFASWEGDFLRNVVGGNRMPGGVTRMSGLPEGTLYLSVFAADNNGGIGSDTIEMVAGEEVHADYIPIVCPWSNGRHEPPEALKPTFEEMKEVAEAEGNYLVPFLDDLLAEQGITVEHSEDMDSRMAPYRDHFAVEVTLPSGRSVRFADVLAALAYKDLQRMVTRRRER